MFDLDFFNRQPEVVREHEARMVSAVEPFLYGSIIGREVWRCDVCGTKLSRTDKFCRECGAKLIKAVKG